VLPEAPVQSSSSNFKVQSLHLVLRPPSTHQKAFFKAQFKAEILSGFYRSHGLCGFSPSFVLNHETPRIRDKDFFGLAKHGFF
jgi:hypothetical protein